MAKLKVEQIRQKAKQIVLESDSGIRYSDLVKRILTSIPKRRKIPSTAQFGT